MVPTGKHFSSNAILSKIIAFREESLDRNNDLDISLSIIMKIETSF